MRVFLLFKVLAVKANCRDGGTCLVSFANFDMVCLVLSQLLSPEPFGVEAAYILTVHGESVQQLTQNTFNQNSGLLKTV